MWSKTFTGDQGPSIPTGLAPMSNAPVELVFGLDGELTEVDEQPEKKQPEAKPGKPSCSAIAHGAQAKKQPVIAVDLTADEQRSSLPESIAAWLESVGLNRLIDVFADQGYDDLTWLLDDTTADTGLSKDRMIEIGCCPDEVERMTYILQQSRWLASGKQLLVNQIVNVMPRRGPNENSEGGVARVAAVNCDGTVDVYYVVSKRREKGIPQLLVKDKSLLAPHSPRTPAPSPAAPVESNEKQNGSHKGTSTDQIAATIANAAGTRLAVRTTTLKDNAVTLKDEPDLKEEEEQEDSTDDDDENDDECYFCEDGGDLLCCDFCPKVYHIKCLGKKRPPKKSSGKHCYPSTINYNLVHNQLRSNSTLLL